MTKTRFFVIVVIVVISATVSLGILSQIDIYDYNKYHTVFGAGSPLAETGTGDAVLTIDNCQRYADWLTKHQKEKLTLPEDYTVRYPPWGNQIFPLVDYCTDVGELKKTVNNDSIKWEFQIED